LELAERKGGPEGGTPTPRGFAEECVTL